jgi:5-amino-6-(5-phosphoribosylamino)uracil reductase
VITCAASDDDLRAQTAKVADVIVAGDEAVDLPAARAALEGRGLPRVLCEGGPHLFGDLTAAGLVDELCLSLSPALAGPGAARIIDGTHLDAARPLTLTQVLAADDGFLYCRYAAAEDQ